MTTMYLANNDVNRSDANIKKPPRLSHLPENPSINKLYKNSFQDINSVDRYRISTPDLFMYSYDSQECLRSIKTETECPFYDVISNTTFATIYPPLTSSKLNYESDSLVLTSYDASSTNMLRAYKFLENELSGGIVPSFSNSGYCNSLLNTEMSGYRHSLQDSQYAELCGEFFVGRLLNYTICELHFKVYLK